MEAMVCSNCDLSYPEISLEESGELANSPAKLDVLRIFILARSLVKIYGGADSGDFIRVAETTGPLIRGQIVIEINGYSISGCTWNDAELILSSSEDVKITLLDESCRLPTISSFLTQDFKSTCYFCYLQTIVRSNLYFRTIAYTTRRRKPHETNHGDFHFVSSKEFLKLIKDGVLLEWGLYNGVYYGTPMPTQGRCFLRINDQNGKITSLDSSLESALSSPTSESISCTISDSLAETTGILSLTSFDDSPRHFATKREICDYFWWCHSLVVGAEEFEILELEEINGSSLMFGGFGLYGIGKCSILAVDRPCGPLRLNDIIVSVNGKSLLWLKDSKLLTLFDGYRKLATVSLILVRGFSLVNVFSGMDLPVGWKCTSRGLYEDTIRGVKTRKRPKFFVAVKNDLDDYFFKRREKTSRFELISLDMGTSNLPFCLTKVDQTSSSLWIVDAVHDSCHVEIGDVLIGVGGRSVVETDSAQKILSFVRRMNDATILLQFARGLAHLIRRELPKSLNFSLISHDLVILRATPSVPFGISITTSSYGKYPKLTSPDHPDNVSIIAMNGIFLPYLSPGLISAYIKDLKGLELNLLITFLDDFYDPSTLTSKISQRSLPRGLFSCRSKCIQKEDPERAVTPDDVIKYFRSTLGISVDLNQCNILQRSVTKGPLGIGIRVSACDGVNSLHSLLLVHECTGRVEADIRPGDLLVAIGGRSLLSLTFDESLQVVRSLKSSVPTSVQVARGLSYLVRNAIQFDGPRRVCLITRPDRLVPFGLGLSYTIRQPHPIISRLETDSPAAKCPFVRLGLTLVAINHVGLAGLTEGVVRSILESTPDLSLDLVVAFSGNFTGCPYSPDSVFDVRLDIPEFIPGMTFRELGIHIIVPPNSSYPAIVFVEGDVVHPNSCLHKSLGFIVAINGCAIEGVPTVPCSSVTISVARHEFKINDLKTEDCSAHVVRRSSKSAPFGLSIIRGGHAYPIIVNVNKSSAAHVAGVPCGVEALAIDGVDCSLMTRHDIALKLRGNDSNCLYLLVRKINQKSVSFSLPTTEPTTSHPANGIYDVEVWDGEANCGLVLQGGRNSAPHVIRYLVQGSIASRSSFQVGDEVIQIDGVDVTKLSRIECVTLLSTASRVRARSSSHAPIVAGDV